MPAASAPLAFLLGFVAELTGGTVYVVWLAQANTADVNFTVNVITVLLLLLGFAAGGYGVVRTRSVASYRDAASAHESNWRAEKARADALAAQADDLKTRATEQLSLLEKAQARPDMSLVVEMLERLIGEGEQRTAQAVARIGEMFDAQRRVLQQIEERLAQMNGKGRG